MFLHQIKILTLCTGTGEKGTNPTPQCDTANGWEQYGSNCYKLNSQLRKSWIAARTDCVMEGGDLVSIQSADEQQYSIPNGVSLWMGGHDSVTEGGWEWTDRAPFRYINWASGNPDDYYGEDCLTIYINSGYWNDDNCDYKRGYVCKRRGTTNSVINIQSAFFGRKSDQICPYLDGSTGKLTNSAQTQLLYQQ
uniref:C-type lectin domain-containing protein n=1 Tax=Astyanax mexicanus TaxID=7994 RepID=A0A8B9LV57_ASTMX